ncbi:NAD(P)H-dependent oxidoreductase [Halogeometricum borinquense]|uniref:NAD(P)H-dependent oxidoreductase n=1 Tax=Halogeometricum borinquense TaxID=60847 RepID=A0A6C0UF99_9EURY|nr:NAD(P)H-dependent oxidoreductase [Halogeometricum borinquense]QIB72931.1 NAD(P)H-dependent oxidoreductase [Halogeometricum borinquense]QIQ75110.1 NAD(P)H-dependent oxidoreductase [Halogeometricum borinquense]
MTRIVAICGSRREGSYTRKSLEIVLDAARDAGAETTMLDLGDVDLPLFHPDKDEQGESERLTRLVRKADGVIIGSPVYHGSYSSTFRNFHDYCSKDEYEETAVGLVATAGGGSYGGALEHMRSTIRGVHGHVVPEQVGVRGAYNVYEDDELTDEDVRRRLVSLAESVVAEARRLHPETAQTARADD